MASTNCTPLCGPATRSVIRACIDSITGLSCNSADCGGGLSIQTESCPGSPPCTSMINDIILRNFKGIILFYKSHLDSTIIPTASIRDPRLQIAPYVLPDSMYFFEQTYRRIWV